MDTPEFDAWRPMVAVFIGGIVSMGLEVVSGRIIAPTYGNSVYTWGSILGVFMLALGVGYYVGGKRAADSASVGKLARLMLIASAVMIVSVYLSELIVSRSVVVPVPTRFRPVVPLLLLFGPPTTFIGFISPYAAEVSKSSSHGEASGRVYSAGTVGSIIGAFATTFYLIPNFRIIWIGTFFSAVLLVTAAVISYRPRLKTVVYLGVTLLLITSVVGGTLMTQANTETVYETNTKYHHVTVEDKGNTRYMYFDSQPQSAIKLDNDGKVDYVFTYSKFMHTPFLYKEPEEVDNVLIIGGGGFTLSRRYANEYNATVDVVEIDPEVVRIAREYFRLDPKDNLNVHVGDGRRFLQSTNKTYDVIILDAFQKKGVPFHLTTKEFMQLVHDRLDEDGVYAMNIIGAAEGPASQIVRAEYKTAATTFRNIDAYPVLDDNPRALQNVILVATKEPSPGMNTLQQRARDRRQAIGLNLTDDVTHYRSGEQFNLEPVPVLKDGRAPVVELVNPQVGRSYIVEQTTNSSSSSG